MIPCKVAREQLMPHPIDSHGVHGSVQGPHRLRPQGHDALDGAVVLGQSALGVQEGVQQGAAEPRLKAAVRSPVSAVKARRQCKTGEGDT